MHVPVVPCNSIRPRSQSYTPRITTLRNNFSHCFRQLLATSSDYSIQSKQHSLSLPANARHLSSKRRRRIPDSTNITHGLYEQRLPEWTIRNGLQRHNVSYQHGDGVQIWVEQYTGNQRASAKSCSVFDHLRLTLQQCANETLCTLPRPPLPSAPLLSPYSHRPRRRLRYELCRAF